VNAINVRVRGIYATAISKILYDKGFNISHASKKIKERLKLKEANIPPDVTVKDLEHKQGVLIIGSFDEGKKVYETLINEISPPVTYVSKLPFHGIIKGEVVEVKNGVSIVDLGIKGINGVLREQLSVGEEVIVDVSRPLLPPEKTAVLSRNYMIHGKYVVLIHGRRGKVFFSEHIVDSKLKRSLKTISSLMKIEGKWGIKWRSAASIGKLDEIMLDLQNTAKYANDVLSKFEKAKKGEVIYRGQFFGILLFISNVKDALDEVRSKIYPTVKGHHRYKSLSDELTELVDYSEFIILEKPEFRSEISKTLEKYVIEKIMEKGKVEIEHISILSNEVKKLTPGHVVNINLGSDETVFTVKRVFKAKGVFDGLNVEKSPGDYDLMEFSTKYPLILHKYFSRNGSLKGIYLNINSPPEVVPGIIRYVDYEVDVAATSNEVKILDKDKLEKAVAEGIIVKDEASKIMKITMEAYKILDSMKKELEKLKIEDFKQIFLKKS